MLDAPCLTLRGITKSFRGVLANDGVDLDIRRGEVHAIVGENGAGKSTLVKILYGFYRADAGEIRLDGAPAAIRSPHDARRLGIGLVFQELVQVPALTVAENVALFLPDLPAVIDHAALARRIEETSRRYGLGVNPDAPIWRLSVGERQKVEIVKLLLADLGILVFDEPTRSLAPHEVASLLAVFANLRRDGYAVVFIAHKLAEVLAGADRMTVMRRGRIAGTLTRAEASEAALVALMFAAPLGGPGHRPRPTRPAGPQALELRGVSTRAEGHAPGLTGVDLAIAAGEIVGVAGVSGNGQRELGDVILGVEPCAAGGKWLWGQEATRWPVARVRASGVAFVPEDALTMAAAPGLTVLENMALGDPGRYARLGGLAMDWAAARADLARSLERLAFSIPPADTRLGALSGGTIQRAILAREMAHGPRLIVALYPTRGLDLASALAARETLIAARDGGAGVLLISEDLDELCALSDRLVVLLRGRLVTAGRPAELSLDDLGHWMTGTTPARARG